VSLNGHAIESCGDLTDRLDRTLARTEVVLDVVRGKHNKHFTVRTVSRPPSASKLPATPDSSSNSDPKTVPPSPPAVPKPDDLRLSLPREVIDRLDRLERQVQALEKRIGSPP
jgi:hypothetical protein